MAKGSHGTSCIRVVPPNPLTDEELKDKFRQLTEGDDLSRNRRRNSYVGISIEQARDLSTVHAHTSRGS
jgi:hypothetical protein